MTPNFTQARYRSIISIRIWRGRRAAGHLVRDRVRSARAPYDCCARRHLAERVSSRPPIRARSDRGDYQGEVEQIAKIHRSKSLNTCLGRAERALSIFSTSTVTGSVVRREKRLRGGPGGERLSALAFGAGTPPELERISLPRRPVVEDAACRPAFSVVISRPSRGTVPYRHR